jgi:hypothetical protein
MSGVFCLVLNTEENTRQNPNHSLVILLTKRYLTRPWCLAELHAALEANILIVPVNLIGGGFNFVDGAQFICTLTPQYVSECCSRQWLSAPPFCRISAIISFGHR